MEYSTLERVFLLSKYETHVFRHEHIHRRSLKLYLLARNKLCYGILFGIFFFFF